MSTNTLVEVPFEDWPKLKDLYAVRKLESNSCNLIQNYINWLNKDPSLEKEIKLYALNGDWSDGTFILQDHKRYTMANTLEDSQERLLAALDCLDKKPEFVFLGSPERIKKTMETYLSRLGFENNAVPFFNAISYHIELEKALEINLDPPKGITLQSLSTKDIDVINNEWPHNHPGSETFIERLMTLNRSVGAYDESDGKLVAWCLVLPLGVLGLLQVLKSHKRKGLGSLVVQSMAKTNAQNGVETLAYVLEENTPSRTMFKNLGFQALHKLFWFTKPSLE